MDLTKKPLYALRSLAHRIGVQAGTKYTKTELVKKIEERRLEMENGKTYYVNNNLGRPRITPCYIDWVQKEDGKIEFVELKESNIPPAPEPEPEPPKRPIIDDPIIREKLYEASEILRTLYVAIDELLEGLI